MKDSTSNVNSRRGALFVLLLALVAGLIPVAVAQAKVKLKDGVYYQSGTVKKPAFGYVQADKGKVVGAGFYVKFKNKSGKACVPSGYTDTEGYISLNFETNKVKPKSSGKFTVKNKKSPYTPGLKATVSGKFKSSTKASIKLKAKADGCTARGNFTKAVYTAGG